MSNRSVLLLAFALFPAVLFPQLISPFHTGWIIFSSYNLWLCVGVDLKTCRCTSSCVTAAIANLNLFLSYLRVFFYFISFYFLHCVVSSISESTKKKKKTTNCSKFKSKINKFGPLHVILTSNRKWKMTIGNTTHAIYATDRWNQTYA